MGVYSYDKVGNLSEIARRFFLILVVLTVDL